MGGRGGVETNPERLRLKFGIALPSSSGVSDERRRAMRSRQFTDPLGKGGKQLTAEAEKEAESKLKGLFRETDS